MKILISNIVLSLVLTGVGEAQGIGHCERLFRTTVDKTPGIVQELPAWRDLPIHVQFEKHGVALTDWAPKLTPDQVDEIHALVGRSETVLGKHSAYFSLVDQMSLRTETVQALRDFLVRVQTEFGASFDGIMLLDETSRRVPHGHVHDGDIWFATGTVALEGLGSWLEIEGERFQTREKQMVIFRNGRNGIFHGTPKLAGPQLLMAFNFRRPDESRLNSSPPPRSWLRRLIYRQK